MKIVIIVAIVVGLGVIGIGYNRRHQSPPTTAAATLAPGYISYLPLGDSYTIGQSVDEQARWPNQLVARLAQAGVKLQLVANPSVTGYTTQNLIDRELPLLKTYHPAFVTILIGVNDYVQGVSATTFQENLTTILDAVQQSQGDKPNIVLVTIPDYGRTPTGARYGSPAESAAGIAAFNKIITAAGVSRHLPVADIFTISQGVTNDPSLTADDGLHPSAKQYQLWTAAIYQTITAAKLFTPSQQNSQ